VLGGCAQAGVGVAKKKEPPPHIASALSWLPTNVETIVVANMPVTVPDQEFVETKSEPAIVSFTALMGLPKKSDFFPGFKAHWIVFASRNVRPAGGIGICPFDGVTILAGETAELDRVTADFSKKAIEKKTILGREVHILEEQDADLWTFYLVAEGDRLLVATNESILEDTLKAMDSPRREPAHEIMELWAKIDPEAPYWALRTFTDRSRKLSYGMNMGDDQLQGYAVQLDKHKTQLTITQRTKAKQGNAHARMFWGNMDTQNPTTAKFEEKDGDLEIIFGPDEEDWRSIPFYLIAALGMPAFL
jgi:hypothetical protein